MASVRSIFEYVKTKCYNRLCDVAKQFVNDSWDLLDMHSSRVPDIQAAEFVDATIERVYVSDLPGDRIAFDVGLELEVAVSASGRHNDYEDECFPWIRISCEGNLACGLDGWEITDIAPYAKKNPPPNSLSDALVPYIAPDKMEAIAHKFLEDHYPEAINCFYKHLLEGLQFSLCN